MGRILLVFLIVVISFPSSARRKKRKSRIYTSILSDSFTDLKASSSTVSETLSSALTIELGLRLTSGFSLLLVSSSTGSDVYSSYGLGGRANFPGFFMIGSRRKDLKLQRKKYPVNTSAYFLLNSHTGEEGAPNAKTVTTKIGLTMDFFLFNPIVFLQTNFGIFNYQGNAFTNVGVGLGAEF